MESKRVTIKDVASAIGVTPQTVSRVFRSNGYVSADTRLKVLDAADRLKYVPNSVAIRLRTGGSKSVAVVFDSLINVYFAVMVDYLQKELQANGYEIQTIFLHSHTITESVYRQAISGGASAIISFLEPDDTLGNVVKALGVPLMILGRRSEIDVIDYMTTDDINGGALAAQKLIQSGCKSFAYMSVSFGITCVQDRYKGFAEVLEKNGFTAYTLDSTGGVLDAIEFFKAQHGSLPDGIFCFSDMLAYDTVKCVRSMGADVKVVGYDDIQADISMPIDLTTIGTNKPKFVQTVVKMLLDKIEGKVNDRIALSIAVTLHNGETA
ncbi:MAG: LacI family DNA-binding transcriptional regulator [Clostridiales bacterium]|nr:LacI family DNA-binding transcriptional regulator [Clostridiales bacterium]